MSAAGYSRADCTVKMRPDGMHSGPYNEAAAHLALLNSLLKLSQLCLSIHRLCIAKWIGLHIHLQPEMLLSDELWP